MAKAKATKEIKKAETPRRGVKADEKVALIKKGCLLAVKKAKIEEELKEVKDAIMQYFGDGKEIITPEGTAILTISKSYSLPEYNLPKVKEEIGSEFELYFEPKVSYGLTKTCHALLKNTGDERNPKILPFIEIKESKYVSFKGLNG